MEYIKLGTIIGSFSLDGTLKVMSTTDFAKERYQEGNTIYLLNKKKEYLPLTVVSFRMNGKLDFVKVNEINTKEEAESYKGCDLLIDKEEANVPKGYYRFSDLEGCEVILEDENVIGKVKKVEEYPAQATLRVKMNNGKELLIPFVKAFIVKVDISKKVIVVRLIEGMI
ncbi:MAG: 16S rRNA processing protein RimM [Bacilli bacterium]|nr:16S rRNA processing protein RimM [Bacilli bacterium]